jgi:ATP-dependent helicase HrpB
MLPIDPVLPDLLAALDRDGAAVLVAPPGAGKTTRVPLALLDASWRGDGRILVLEPRRLAARAAARRMAGTLGEDVGRTVGFRVRMESRVSAATRIEVVTEGVFTRMIVDDPSLDGVAAVLFDEAHERSLDGDLGLALAIEARGALRPDLRLLVMSATIDGARFAALLGGGQGVAGANAPVIESEGRAFPVETRHRPRDARTRLEDAVAEAVLSALAEEPGSILAFLPGQGEITRTAERLAGRLPADVDLAPLYGALDGAAQDRAIRPSPPGRRKVVLATSIAETSITIDGVRVVVDGGLARKPRYEPATGLTRLETVRVSRAAADQRRGRAGRTEAGVCIRLWEAGQTAALAPHDRPEILDSDLSGLVLDLAAWGVTDPATLAFLEPPPAPAWREAVDLLVSLDALDTTGRLTAEGEALRKLPLPPRLAHMLHRAADESRAGLAADLAVLLSERGLGGDDVDLRERLRRFSRERSRRADDARRLADRLVGSVGGRRGDGDVEAAGAVLALAFPERLAQARGGPGKFRLANGRGAVLDPADALAREPFLAVADLSGSAEAARILAAAPISRAEIESDFRDRITTEETMSFDAGSGSVRGRRVRRLDRLVLAEEAIPASGEAATAALMTVIRDHGLDRLPWTPRLRRLRERAGFLHRHSVPGFPDVSDAALAASADAWLAPYIPGKTRFSDIRPAELEAALTALFPAGGERLLDRLVPEELQTPGNRSVPIDYGRDPPVAAVRVQDLFGLDRHPTVADGKVLIVLELLSPANRPIQVTADLPGFWRGSWAAVRADLRGRYPKHAWPEDPLTAPPVRIPRKNSA